MGTKDLLYRISAIRKALEEGAANRAYIMVVDLHKHLLAMAEEEVEKE